MRLDLRASNALALVSVRLQLEVLDFMELLCVRIHIVAVNERSMTHWQLLPAKQMAFNGKGRQATDRTLIMAFIAAPDTRKTYDLEERLG